MLRRTHNYKYQDGVSLTGDVSGDPIQTLDRNGYSLVANWTAGSTSAKTFAAGVAQETDLTCVADVGKREVTEITCVADVGAREVTEITCIADAGTFEVATVTWPAVAGATQGDYVVISNKAGTTWAAWLDIDAAGTAPTGAAYVAATNKVKVSVLTGDDAATVRAAALTALGAMTDLTPAAGAAGASTFTSTKMGNVADPVPHNADDSGAGGITASAVDGVASNLNNTYFTINSVNAVTKAVKAFYVWFNVNGEGTDPAVVGKTAVPVAITAGAQANTDVAAAVDVALAALTNDFTSSVLGAVVTITNKKVGAVVDAANGAASPVFVFNVTTQGVDSNLNNKWFSINSVNAVTKVAKAFYVWFNVDGLGTDPAVAGKTAIPVAISFGSQTNANVATAVDTELAALTNDFSSSPAAEIVTVTNKKVGAVVDADNGTASPAFTFNVTTQGVDSNLNNKYFTIASGLNANKLFGWFNVDGLGTAPVVAGYTAVPITISYGAQQLNTGVAGQVNGASFTGMTQSVVGAVVSFVNDDEGACESANAATSGFTATVTQIGSSPVDVTADTATVASHGLVTGAKVALTTSGALPTGLVGTMYVIVVNANVLRFATTLARALAGTYEDITDNGSGTQTITPAALSGSFKLQASNNYDPDRLWKVATWTDITGSSTSASGAGSFGWNVSDVYYAWVRLVWTWTEGTGNVTTWTCVKD